MKTMCKSFYATLGNLTARKMQVSLYRVLFRFANLNTRRFARFARRAAWGSCLAAVVAATLPRLETTARGADRQTVPGQVPAAVAKLKLPAVGRLPASGRLRLHLMLPPRNQEAIAPLLEQVYDPTSTNFHRYLTPAQYDERFAPTEEDYQATIRFTREHGLTVVGTVPGRTILEVEGSVADIEQAMHIVLGLYQHPTEARSFYAPGSEPSLDLAVPIIAISGLDNFTLPGNRLRVLEQISPGQSEAGLGARPKQARTSRDGGSYPGGVGLFMGSDFRHAFASDTALTGTGQAVAVLEWNSLTPNDIAQYKSTTRLPNVPVTEVRVGVSQNLNNGDAEVPLDVDMVLSMAPGVSEIIVVHGSDYDSLLTEVANPTQGEPRPLQIGCSIFGNADNNTPNCLARLALQGQSYFYASGDIGAYPVEPAAGGVYLTGMGPTDVQPYMVQVGGTHMVMTNQGAGYVSEVVWSGSSGGYQTPLPIPAFQQWINLSAVGGSTVYRNMPDVAAPADNILVFCTNTNGIQRTLNIGGTSCSAPLWAGFAALVNQQAQGQGNPSLGYAAPAIYAIAQGARYASAFHDVLSGDNTNDRSPTLFYAAPGYDLCTGWGSPKGANLIYALAGYGGPVFVDFNYAGPASNGSGDGPGSYDYPYKTLADGVNGVSAGGTIFIKTAGTSAETMHITKPMTITASDGAATVGR
jgi:subtilase family serine protease